MPRCEHVLMTMDISRSVRDGRIRVATLNLFGLRENWGGRKEVTRSGFADLQPDFVCLQEVIKTSDYEQVRDVLGRGYEVVHHSERLADEQGDSTQGPGARRRRRFLRPVMACPRKRNRASP